MRGFAVHSTEYDPQRLYATGDADRLDARTVEQVVRAGDEPLALLLDGEANRILWTFRGDRRTKTTRTGTFVADCRCDEGALFAAFKADLRRLHEADGWTLPKYDDVRWNAGFELDQVDPGWAGLSDGERARILDHAEASGGSAPLVFGMESFESALAALVALHENGVQATVGIGSDAYGVHAQYPDVDVLLCPRGASDFTPLSASATGVVGSRSGGNGGLGDTPAEMFGDASGDSVGGATRRDTGRRVPRGLENRIAGMALLIVLGFSLYSFVSAELFHPITGLGAIGGFLGSVVAAPFLLEQSGAVADPDGYAATVRSVLTGRTDHGIGLVALGTVAGYLFPTVFRVGGKVLLGSRWLFGSIGSVATTLPSVVLYVVVLYLSGIGLGTVLGKRDRSRRRSDGGTRRPLRVRLAIGAAIFGTALVLATGLAEPVWYVLVPAA